MSVDWESRSFQIEENMHKNAERWESLECILGNRLCAFRVGREDTIDLLITMFSQIQPLL